MKFRSWFPLVAVLASAGCGTPPVIVLPDLPAAGDMAGGCKSDTDCKQGQKCVTGQCKNVDVMEMGGDVDLAMGGSDAGGDAGDTPDLTMGGSDGGDTPDLTDTNDLVVVPDLVVPLQCQKNDECKALDGGGGGNAAACCAGKCVDTSSDTANCGGCGMACAMGQSCCNSACVDLKADTKNCGACNVACNFQNGAGACMAGKCSLGMCNAGFGDCDKVPDNGCEADLNGDPMNCLGCGNTCQAANATAGCKMGCVVGKCNDGFADCDVDPKNGCEVSTLADDKNCGGCKMVCGVIMNGQPKCDTGKCVLGGCSGTFGDCDMNAMNGCEVDTAGDIKHCGGCGKPCAVPANGTASCVMGVCGSKCTAPFADCNMSAMDGCEVDTSKDAKNCGGCNKGCVVPANASATCTNGVCGFTCNMGFADCDMNAANGCEVNTATDINNCKTCKNKCPTPMNGAPTCINSVCGVGACGGAFKDCDMNANNGCESDTLNDINNCFTCGMKCATPANSAATCKTGMCGFNCNGGFANCDANAGNGCEVNTTNDPKNCSVCNKACTVANGVPGCTNSSCVIASCTMPFADCVGGVADGCETNTSSNIAHCGGCGKVCPAGANSTATCTMSACGLACTMNFGNCDNMAANGCEANLTNDVNNCKACGTKCAAIANGTPSCNNGACAIGSCNAPFLNCDANLANGCEANSSNDAKNCGGCGIVCANGAACANGLCKGKVLIVGAPGTATWNNDVQAKLVGTAAFGGVDIFNANTGTPSLAQLKAYEAILVYSDTGFANAMILGNNVADYYDGGGRVVIAVFANASVALTGRWATGNYQLINPTGQAQPAEAGAITIAEASPLTTGVTALTATAGYKSTGGAINGGIVVASWGSRAPLMVRGVKGGRGRCDINMYPPSSAVRADFWKGDGAIIMKNALLFRGFCHSIVGKNGGACASGKTEYCDPAAPLVATSEAQAKGACDACYGISCFRETADCAGVGFGPKAAGTYVCGDAYFGSAAGCSGAAGRIWSICSSNTTYGRWAP